jgi:hypothetical protein
MIIMSEVYDPIKDMNGRAQLKDTMRSLYETEESQNGIFSLKEKHGEVPLNEEDLEYYSRALDFRKVGFFKDGSRDQSNAFNYHGNGKYVFDNGEHYLIDANGIKHEFEDEEINLFYFFPELKDVAGGSGNPIDKNDPNRPWKDRHPKGYKALAGIVTAGAILGATGIAASYIHGHYDDETPYTPDHGDTTGDGVITGNDVVEELGYKIEIKDGGMPDIDVKGIKRNTGAYEYLGVELPFVEDMIKDMSFTKIIKVHGKPVYTGLHEHDNTIVCLDSDGNIVTLMKNVNAYGGWDIENDGHNIWIISAENGGKLIVGVDDKKITPDQGIIGKAYSPYIWDVDNDGKKDDLVYKEVITQGSPHKGWDLGETKCIFNIFDHYNYKNSEWTPISSKDVKELPVYNELLGMINMDDDPEKELAVWGPTIIYLDDNLERVIDTGMCGIDKLIYNGFRGGDMPEYHGLCVMDFTGDGWDDLISDKHISTWDPEYMKMVE